MRSFRLSMMASRAAIGAAVFLFIACLVAASISGVVLLASRLPGMYEAKNPHAVERLTIMPDGQFDLEVLFSRRASIIKVWEMDGEHKDIEWSGIGKKGVWRAKGRNLRVEGKWKVIGGANSIELRWQKSDPKSLWMNWREIRISVDSEGRFKLANDYNVQFIRIAELDGSSLRRAPFIVRTAFSAFKGAESLESSPVGPYLLLATYVAYLVAVLISIYWSGVSYRDILKVLYFIFFPILNGIFLIFGVLVVVFVSLGGFQGMSPIGLLALITILAAGFYLVSCKWAIVVHRQTHAMGTHSGYGATQNRPRHAYEVAGDIAIWALPVALIIALYFVGPFPRAVPNLPMEIYMAAFVIAPLVVVIRTVFFKSPGGQRVAMAVSFMLVAMLVYLLDSELMDFMHFH